jgi:hypothetical protein
MVIGLIYESVDRRSPWMGEATAGPVVLLVTGECANLATALDVERDIVNSLTYIRIYTNYDMPNFGRQQVSDCFVAAVRSFSCRLGHCRVVPANVGGGSEKGRTTRQGGLFGSSLVVA